MALAFFRFNLLGLASSFLLFYAALSNNPWWTVYGGIGDERTFSAEVSPFNISVEVLGKAGNSADAVLPDHSGQTQHPAGGRNNALRFLAGQ